MANALKYQWSPDEAIDKLYKKGFMDGTNVGFLQSLIDNAIEIEENAFFWQGHFRVEGNEYQIDLADLKKNPAWTVRQIVRRSVPMADAMAPLSETMQLDAEGGEEKTGSIYQYGKGLFETSMSKEELKARLRELGTDQNLITGFVRGVADLVKTHNLRVSNMAAMTLSRGGQYGNTINLGTVAAPKTTQGASGVVANQAAYIPLANYKTAGTKVWTAADCDIPEQMMKIEYDFKEANYIPDSTPFEWNISWDMMVNVLIKNAAFIKEVNRYLALGAPDKVIIVQNGTSTTDVGSITVDQLVAYSNWELSKISPIRIVREQQTVQGMGTTYTTVKGWKDGVAVLRPRGYAGVLVHAQVPDVELMRSGEVNKTIDFSLARVQGFLNVINKVTPNGMLKSYHTDVIGRYATVLSESQYHVCVDTTTADA